MQKLARRIIFGMTCALPLFFIACSNDEMDEQGVCCDEPVWVRALQPLTVSPIEPLEAGRANRVVLNDEGASRVVSAQWQTSDRVGVWNITAARLGQRGFDVVQPESEGRLSAFKGDVHCAVGDELAMVYPYSTSAFVSVDNSGTLDLDLRCQKGTLSDIAENFDLVYGKATVEKISAEGVATARFGKLESAINIFALSFADDENKLLEIDRVHMKIVGGTTQAQLRLDAIGTGNELVFSGPDTVLVNPSDITTNIYVALLGNVSGKELLFDIVDKYGFSHQARAKLKDNVAPAQVVRGKLRAKPGDYVEIEDIRIAKGNLIWDQGPATNIGNSILYKASYDFGLEHYFIAPHQAWAPEQFTDSRASGCPRWPEASPVDGNLDNVYYSTFINTSASKHGLISARGQVPSRNSNQANSYTQTYINATIPPGGFSYNGRLFNQYNDLNSFVDLADVLSGAVQGGWNLRTFYGDLAYLATRGKYRLPTPGELTVIFNTVNKKWAVYRINTANRYMNYYDGTAIDGDMANVYGLLMWRPGASSYISSLPTVDGGSTIVIDDETLKKAIFLPADGNRGWNDFIYPYNAAKPGKGCAYLSGYINEGGITAYNCDLFQAYLEDGLTKTIRNAQNRLRTGSIRPVLCDDKKFVFD